MHEGFWQKNNIIKSDDLACNIGSNIGFKDDRWEAQQHVGGQRVVGNGPNGLSNYYIQN